LKLIGLSEIGYMFEKIIWFLSKFAKSLPLAIH
jgi:hypothetical protein